MTKGLLIVLSGPSGVGKGTVLKEFIHDADLNLSYSVSLTTRKQRPGEVDGVNYFFVSKAEFERAQKAGELLESAEFVGNYYGTSLKQVEQLRNQGKNVILEIEVQGCQQVQKKVEDALTIFIVPAWKILKSEFVVAIQNRKKLFKNAWQRQLEKWI